MLGDPSGLPAMADANGRLWVGVTAEPWISMIGMAQNHYSSNIMMLYRDFCLATIWRCCSDQSPKANCFPCRGAEMGEAADLASLV